MRDQLNNLARWANSSPAAHMNWNEPAEYLSSVAEFWVSEFANKFRPWREGAERAAHDAWLFVRTVVDTTQVASHGGLRQLRKDPLAMPLSEDLLRRDEPTKGRRRSRVCSEPDAVIQARKAIRRAIGLHRANPYLAAIALEYEFRRTGPGKHWLTLWMPKSKGKPKAAVRKASAVAHALSVIIAALPMLEGLENASQPHEPIQSRPVPSAVKAVASPYLTLKEAAETFGLKPNGKPHISSDTLRRAFLANELSGMRVGTGTTGHILIERKDLERFKRDLAGKHRHVLSTREVAEIRRSAADK